MSTTTVNENMMYSNNRFSNIIGHWRDVICPCGSIYHFSGKITDLFRWERIHIKHMVQDVENHSMLSFYPNDMIIYYHSKTGYVVERRKHKPFEVNEVKQAYMNGKVTLAGV